MFGGILAKLLGVGLIAALVGGGVLYVQKLRLERDLERARAEATDERNRANAAEANLKVAEQTINIFRQMEDSHEAIDRADSDAVVDFLRTGVWPHKAPGRDSKGNDVSAPAGTPENAQPNRGQKR